MTYYDPFDCKINCEELLEVSPEEQEEVFALIAEENEAQQGFTQWLESIEDFERWLDTPEGWEWEDKFDVEPTERQAAIEQAIFEHREALRKDWSHGYSNKDDGPTYGGIAI